MTLRFVPSKEPGGVCRLRGRRAASLMVSAWVLLSALACPSPFAGMKQELDGLSLPDDYVLLEERVSGGRLAFFGAIPRVVRSYRSPRPFRETCNEIRKASEEFSDSYFWFQESGGDRGRTCLAPFARRAYTGGLTAVSPWAAEGSEKRTDDDGRDFVLVHAQLLKH